MKLRSVTCWLSRPISGWSRAALGCVLAAAGAYWLITVFYVKPIDEYAAPAALQALLGLAVIGCGVVCAYTGFFKADP